MLDSLTSRLARIVKTIRGEARLTEANVQDALREVRIALLEADVALPVVKHFIDAVRAKALGQEVIGSLTPGQALVGVVHRELAQLMGEANVGLDLAVAPPAVILMAGLQGSGKTTTVGKLALFLKGQKKKVLVVSCDVYRPAAIEQLKTVAAQAGVEFFPSHPDEKPLQIGKGALEYARTHYCDVVIVDTAGRLHTRQNLMEELKKIHRIIAREVPGAPHETFLVLDATIGLNAVAQAREFHQAVGVSGLIIAKLDGTAKGGAVVAIAQTLQLPVRYVGVGEGPDDLQPFDPREFATALFS